MKVRRVNPDELSTDIRTVIEPLSSCCGIQQEDSGPEKCWMLRVDLKAKSNTS